MALRDKVNDVRTQMVNKAVDHVNVLASTASEVRMEQQAGRLKTIGESIRSDHFKIIMIGRFKNGKSTLMNALLGGTTHRVSELGSRQGPMPVDDLPCTATLTRIEYSERPWVRMVRFDGTTENWSLERYLKDAVVRDKEEDNVKFFGPIKEFQVGFPASLCQSGVMMIDAPGTDDVAQRTAVTREALTSSDVAIVVYRSDAFAGKSEREFVAEDVSGTGTRVFTVVNMFHGKVADDRFKGFVWNRLIHEEGKGPEYEKSNKDFLAHDIYFVDALKALEGKWKNDQRLVTASGLETLEHRLSDFLLKERLYTHLEKHVINAADREGPSILQRIRQLREALQRDLGPLKQAYEEAQRKFARIRERRDNLPRLFTRYRGEAQRELKTSFAAMINQLRLELPGELKRAKLPSDSFWASVRVNKLVTEASEASGAIIKKRIEGWTETDAPNILTPVVTRMMEEIEDEITRIDSEFKEIAFSMTGVDPRVEGKVSGPSMTERILAGLGGLLMFDLSMIVGGGGGGWRGLAGVFVGKLAGAVLLTALGVTSAAIIVPVMIVAAVAGSLVGTGIGLVDRIKADVAKNADKELGNAAMAAAPDIEREVTRIFDDLQDNIMNAVLGEIIDEEQKAKLMVEQNQQDQATKTRNVEGLTRAEQRVQEAITALKGLLTTARQAA